ncbi:cytochrome c biogenesis protein DipZ [Variovorax paradoxus]|uniref:cytochrome c biogenesis protein DipZ n=1 Tax=Variovorax paradoxus TaxID=34073 RepID=UPI001932460C|nr:cytochrome c biogenesis protein DipZ [Variovorax paradoxus]
MLQTLLALGAGVATVGSPCILPMLPLLLGATLAPTGPSARTASLRPLLIVAGFVLSFAAAALAFGASTRVLGLSPQALRDASIVVLLAFGLLLSWPRLLDRLAAPLGFLADAGQRLGDRAGASHRGALLLGASLGLLWTPCAGPVLASVLTLIATEEQSWTAAWLLLMYAIGAGVPMLAIAYGGQAASARIRVVAKHMHALRRVFGLLMMATALAMALPVDTQLSAWLSRAAWSSGGSSSAASVTTAPDFVGIDQWFNSPALTIEGLRGQVVLVDFWTHGCVNCVNTLPHLREWARRYRERGLVVVGVHTPEFAFERDAAGLQSAIRRHGIDYPVAQDNRYRTWKAWGTAYWPSLYLVDRTGRVVFRHVGEGDYEHIERQIEQALQ